MNWLDEYKRKLVSAEEAVSAIKSGDRVSIQPGVQEPELLVKAMIARAPELRDVELIHVLTFGDADYVKPEYEGHFRHVAFFIGGNVRKAVAAGQADVALATVGSFGGDTVSLGGDSAPLTELAEIYDTAFEKAVA